MAFSRVLGGSQAKTRAAAPPDTRSRPTRPLPWFLGGLLAIIIQVGGAALGVAAPATAAVLEDLQYRVDVWIWRDAARVQLRLEGLGAGRYRAEVTGVALGLAALVSGHRRDRYQTEMVLKEGRLLPVLYREESHRRGKARVKEYRFDYARERLELWQGQTGRELELKWHAALTTPIHDPLSALYNGRLGFLGPLTEGNTLKFPGIPYPQPEEYEVRLGPETPAGRQVMVVLVNKAFANRRGLIFVTLDAKRVPTQVWSRVLRFGKIVAQLLPGGQPLKAGLPELGEGCQVNGGG